MSRELFFRLLGPIIGTLIWFIWQVSVVRRGVLWHRRNFYFGPPLVTNSAAFLAVEALARWQMFSAYSGFVAYVIGAGLLAGWLLAAIVWCIVFAMQAVIWLRYDTGAGETTVRGLIEEVVFLGVLSNFLAFGTCALYIVIIGTSRIGG
jgi:hypothetical protein